METVIRWVILDYIEAIIFLLAALPLILIKAFPFSIMVFITAHIILEKITEIIYWKGVWTKNSDIKNLQHKIFSGVTFLLQGSIYLIGFAKAFGERNK